jgi:hypothetical protein
MFSKKCFAAAQVQLNVPKRLTPNTLRTNYNDCSWERFILPQALPPGTIAEDIDASVPDGDLVHFAANAFESR